MVLCPLPTTARVVIEQGIPRSGSLNRLSVIYGKTASFTSISAHEVRIDGNREFESADAKVENVEVRARSASLSTYAIPNSKQSPLGPFVAGAYRNWVSPPDGSRSIAAGEYTEWKARTPLTGLPEVSLLSMPAS